MVSINVPPAQGITKHVFDAERLLREFGGGRFSQGVFPCRHGWGVQILIAGDPTNLFYFSDDKGRTILRFGIEEGKVTSLYSPRTTSEVLVLTNTLFHVDPKLSKFIEYQMKGRPSASIVGEVPVSGEIELELKPTKHILDTKRLFNEFGYYHHRRGAEFMVEGEPTYCLYFLDDTGRTILRFGIEEGRVTSLHSPRTASEVLAFVDTLSRFDPKLSKFVEYQMKGRPSASIVNEWVPVRGEIELELKPYEAYLSNRMLELAHKFIDVLRS